MIQFLSQIWIFLILCTPYMGIVEFLNSIQENECTQDICKKVEHKFDNLDYGIPGKCDVMLERDGYSVGYSTNWKQAVWVSYRLTRDEVMSNEVERGSFFARDRELEVGYSTPQDYANSGYDKGHLAPAADMMWADKAMKDSFLMSNVSPQAPSFNRGIWSSLEQWCREKAKKETNIVIVTGPIVTTNDLKNTIGRNRVVIPSAFYKVIYDETPPCKMIGFIMPNKGTKDALSAFVVTVNCVEGVTLLDFFNELPDELEEKLEVTSDFDSW